MATITLQQPSTFDFTDHQTKPSRMKPRIRHEYTRPENLIQDIIHSEPQSIKAKASKKNKKPELLSGVGFSIKHF